MTISATTQGLRPGVCTSTSRPSSPFDGMVIYETDTNRVLVWDNSAWVMIADTDSPPGLQLIKTQAIGTAVSTVVVSDVFSADYENYQILINGGAGSTNAILRLTLGATTTGYYYGNSTITYGGTGGTGSGSNVAFFYGGEMTAQTLACNITVINPFLATRTTFHSTSATTRTDGYNLMAGGYLNDTTSYTAFTITTSTGTITGGTIRVYGFRNS